MIPKYPSLNQTLASLVSPPGTGGISIIQMVGPHAVSTAMRFLRKLKKNEPPVLKFDHPHLLRWMDDEEPIDDVIVITGQHPQVRESVSIHSHGSQRVVERILMCLERADVCIQTELPAQYVWPGIDAIEAAVLGCLPHAQTQAVARWLIAQTPALRQAKESIIQALIQEDIASATQTIQRLLETFQTSQKLLKGADVVIIGPPNVGKSTLANQLFERPWSLESDEPGTTRDWVNQPIAIGEIPMNLVDTVGIHDSKDDLEQLAIRETIPLIQSADVQLLVFNWAQPTAWEHLNPSISRIISPEKIILVLNKCDLIPSALQQEVAGNIGKIFQVCPSLQTCDHSPILLISALKQIGIDKIRESILDILKLRSDRLPVPAIFLEEHRQILKDVLIMAPNSSKQAIKALQECF